MTKARAKPPTTDPTTNVSPRPKRSSIFNSADFRAFVKRARQTEVRREGPLLARMVMIVCV
jgi:hypothetical protein